MQEPVAFLTLTLIGITVLTSYRGFKKQAFFDRYKFDVESILRGRQYYRVVSSAFLHADLGHLLLNSFCFYFFAEDIELLFGWHIILWIYFLSVLAGSLLSLLLHRNHYEYSAVGASGGVSGIMFASIFLLPGGEIVSLWIPVGIPASIFSVLYVLVSLYGIKSQVDNVGHDAHLGGAMTGMIFAAVMYPMLVMQSIFSFIVITILLIGFFLYASRGSLAYSFKRYSGIRRNSRQIMREKDRAKMNKKLDRLLEKVKKGGIQELSSRDKRKLEYITKKLKGY